MFFSDIHIHLLYGADDGPKTCEEMFELVDKVYAGGTRFICATPHCAPEWYGDNRASVDAAFGELQEYCKNKYPDLKVVLGNELFFDANSKVWLKNGLCRTMNNTRLVLVEFFEEEAEAEITKAVQMLLNSGYVPIIAHAERYFKLSYERIAELRNNGVLVQVNARKNFLGFDFTEKKRLKTLLSAQLVDFVSTDAHNLSSRAPFLPEFYKIVSQKYGVEYAESIFRINAEMLIGATEEVK